MKKNKWFFWYVVDCITLLLLALMIAILSVFNLKTSYERMEIEHIKIAGEIRAASISVSSVGELSVQPKETNEYVVHELTEEDIAEIEYCDSLELLAICVEAEAGNQDLMGKQLVADVILNRVDSPDFPNDIVSVITQKTGDVYQFSSYGDGHMAAVWEPSEETYEAVRIELGYRSNPRVLYFTEGRYNPYCEPGFIHGAHYFGY